MERSQNGTSLRHFLTFSGNKEAAATLRNRIPVLVQADALDGKHELRVPKPAEEAVLASVTAPTEDASPLPRLLVVLAHPDDEVLSLGARLERLAGSRVLTLTDGAPLNGADALHHGFPSLEAYRDARRRELQAAFDHAGVPHRVFAPFTGMEPVADQAAALHLKALTRSVAAAIRAFAPDAVLTHPYEGGHPDHDACAFAVHTAVQLLRSSDEASAASPVIIEAAFYHAGSNGSMRTGEFLPYTGASAAITYKLSAAEQENKRVRLACFVSQAETLSQFSTTHELYRLAPVYDFRRPPHAGKLLYEHFPWGMTGEHFRKLAAEAKAELCNAQPPNGARQGSALPGSPTPENVIVTA